MRVQKFDRAGQFLLTWETGADIKVHGTPEGITVDAAGRIYVTDYVLGRIQIFTADGQPLGAIGTRHGQGDYLAKPVGIAIDATGILYVSDQGSNNVRQFKPR